MVSYYNPLSYTQCANLYPMSNSWYSAAAAANYQQPANASFFGGGAAGAANGVQHHHNQGSSNNNSSSGAFGGSTAPGSGGGGSPDSEGGQQSPMYYQHYQHHAAMFQQGSPEWQAMDRSGSPPSAAQMALNGRQNRMFQYPGFGGTAALSAAQQSHGKMMGATDLRTTTASTNLSMDKLGNPHNHLTALPSPPISSPGGHCQQIKQGESGSAVRRGRVSIRGEMARPGRHKGTLWVY